MTKSHTCKTIPRFHEFVAKARLVDVDGCQAIGCVVSNSDDVLNVEMTNDDNVNSIDTCTPIWDKIMKDCMHADDCDSTGYTLSHFEPIALRFSPKDALENFCFFSKRHAKPCKNDGEGFALDAKCSS